MAFDTPQTKEQILMHRHAKINQGTNADLHAFKTFPTFREWINFSDAGLTFPKPPRLNDPALLRIDDLVALYPKSKGGQGLYDTAEIFFTTMWWLNNFKKDPKMDARRRPSILRLNLSAANQVKDLLTPCALGEVASRLRAMYGTGMGAHGIKTDAENNPHYLTAYEREQYRVVFRDGLAHWIKTEQDGKLRLEPIHVKKDTYMDGNREGIGWVMTVSGTLYVGTFGLNIKAHSCFMAGQPVLSAGTAMIDQGRIMRIKSDSGHYIPVDSTLALVLRKLKFSRVDISKISVECARFKGINEPDPMAGDRFLAANGNWGRAQPLRFGLPTAA
jgi:hypothetical protein